MAKHIELNKYHLPHVVRTAQVIYRALCGWPYNHSRSSNTRDVTDLLDALADVYQRRASMGIPTSGFNPNAGISSFDRRWIRSLAEAEQAAAKLRLKKQGCLIKPPCTFMALVRNLIDLSERVPTLVFNRKTGTLWVHTMPVNLNGIFLGSFQLVLAVGRRNFLDQAELPLSVRMLGYPGSKYQQHPHVRNDRLDFGDQTGQARAALYAGRLLEFFTLTSKILEKYQPWRAYTRLESQGNQDERSCYECGDDRHENAGINCVSQGSVFCSLSHQSREQQYALPQAATVRRKGKRVVGNSQGGVRRTRLAIPVQQQSYPPVLPQLRFNLYAWAKMWFFCKYRPNEFTAYGVFADGEQLLVVDILLPDQRATASTVGHTGLGMERLLERAKRLGYRPNQVARLWIHSHPEGDVTPSPQDQRTFNMCFEEHDWALMVILSHQGRINCHLRMMKPSSLGTGAIQQEISVVVDMTQPFPKSEIKAWQQEYDRHVKVKPRKVGMLKKR